MSLNYALEELLKRWGDATKKHKKHEGFANTFVPFVLLCGDDSPMYPLFMEREITLCVIVRKPPAGVDFGVQEGHGNDYKTVQTQRFTKQDLRFEFPVRVKESKDGQPNFLGPFAQGPANQRFIYLDIGTYAGQTNTPWGRRLKIPLAGITWPMIDQASDVSRVVEICVPGTGRDGGPTCGTVKEIISGWALSQK